MRLLRITRKSTHKVVLGIKGFNDSHPEVWMCGMPSGVFQNPQEQKTD